MSTSIFTFTVNRPYREGIAHLTDVAAAQGGRSVRLAKFPASGLFVVRQAKLKFSSGAGLNSLATFRAFFDARQGRYDSFLYKAKLAEFNLVEGEALGTGDASEDEFALDSKHIDASTLVVYVDDVEQESGYSLTGNNTAPIVDFVTPPGVGEVVTADYEFYWPCVFQTDEFAPPWRAPGDTDANMILEVTDVLWAQDRPGSHLV